MKQKLLKSLLPAVMTAALCLAGCTRSESIANEKSDSELIAQLKSLNDELLMEATPTRLTTRQYLEIASADLFGAYRGGKRGAQIGTAVGAFFGNPITGRAFGAALGGIGYGAFMSYQAVPDNEGAPSFEEIVGLYDDVCVYLNNELEEEEEGEEEDPTILMSPQTAGMVFAPDYLIEGIQLDQSAIRVGISHNLMLAGMQGRLSRTPTTRTRSPEEEEEAGAGDDVTMEDAITYSEDMVALLENRYHDTTEEECVSAMVMGLFDEVFQTYPANAYDVVFLINRYAEIVEASTELTSEEKEWIRMGLAVSLYSYNYWTNYYTN
jgi:hypothetical protein